jgi:Nickel responsive protein SCO4226-like
MARFMDVHTGMKGLTKEQFEQAHRRDLELQAKEHVTFVQAWADPVTGKVFCLSEAPDKDSVKRVHEKAGHGPSEIYEIPLSVK